MKLNLAQKDIPLEFIRDNDSLRIREFTNKFTKADARKKWAEISETINAVTGGAHKNWDQWRKTWLDLKNKGKAYVAQKKKHIRSTGGGPSFSTSDDYGKFTDLISPLLTDGIKGLHEMPIDFNFENNETSLEISIHKNPGSPEMFEIDPRLIVGTSGVRVTHNNTESPPKSNDHLYSTDMPTKKHYKRVTKTTLLENSLRISPNFHKLTEENMRVKQQYYKEKFELLRELLLQVNIIACSLSDIAKSKQVFF